MAAREAITTLRRQIGHGPTKSLANAASFLINKPTVAPLLGSVGLLRHQVTANSALRYPGTSSRWTAARRAFQTTARTPARLVDDFPRLDRSDSGRSAPDACERLQQRANEWSSIAGETARALWRQARARVEARARAEAEERRRCRAQYVRPVARVLARMRRLTYWSCQQRAWRMAAFGSLPSWKTNSRFHSSFGWRRRADRLTEDGVAARYSRDNSCGGGGHAAPVGGCRPSGPGWGWYLVANERRRRDPDGRARFRQVYRTLHPLHPDPGTFPFSTWRVRWRHRHHPSDIPMHHRVGVRTMGPRAFRKSLREHYASRDRAIRRVKRILMRFCVQSPNNLGRRRHTHRGDRGSRHRSGNRSSQLHNAFQGRHTFSDRRRPFEQGKKGAGMIQVGVGTDEYRVAQMMSVRPGAYASSRAQSLGSSRHRPALSLRPSTRMPSRGTSLRVRGFATTSRRANPLVGFLPAPGTLPCATATVCPLEFALPLLLPLATILKSTAALNCLAAITRISLTLLPLSLRGKLVHVMRERYTRDPASLSSSIWSRLTMRAGGTAALETPSSFLARWNAMVGLPLLLLTPLFLLALVAIASLERTPITGRWRIVMLSPAEEAELVDSIFAAAPPVVQQVGSATVCPEGTSRDWVGILKQVLQLPDEGASSSTGRRRLLGGEVLDPRDWRVRWAEATLRALELGSAAAIASTGTTGARTGSAVLLPPPTDYPLELRPEALSHDEGWQDELVLAKPFQSHHAHKQAPAPVLDYDLLVIENDAVNAFSFGFGPGPASAPGRPPERRGVVVVYTGFLREILSSGREAPPPPSPPPPPARTSLLDKLTRSREAAHIPSAVASDPIAANLVPPVLPTDSQTKALAVLLSHELAHLTLSHTLESYASTSLLLPHLARLTTDGEIRHAHTHR